MLTGAGVSAASGVPTFRGTGGLWRSFRAEDLATPQAFQRDPALVWEWYDWRRSRDRPVPSEPGARRAGPMERRPGVTLITQNVDGLHELAGAATSSAFTVRSGGCGVCSGAATRTRRLGGAAVPLPALPPRCPGCGGVARPAVVWFGEAIDSRVLQRGAATDCGVYLSIGTSSLVQPAAGSISRAKSQRRLHGRDQSRAHRQRRRGRRRRGSAGGSGAAGAPARWRLANGAAGSLTKSWAG